MEKFDEIEALAVSQGVDFLACSEHHWQLRDGKTVVNYWPTTRKYAVGRGKGRRMKSISDLFAPFNQNGKEKHEVSHAVATLKAEYWALIRDGHADLAKETKAAIESLGETV